jgi:hypothetical protein
LGDKQPVSVLVVVHTSDLHVLLLERADFRPLAIGDRQP